MLKRIRDLTYQHAIAAALIAFLLIDWALFGLGQLFSILPQTLPVQVLAEVLFVLIPVALVIFFGFSRALKPGRVFRGLFYCWPFIAVQVLALCTFFFQNLGNPEANWRSWPAIIGGVLSIVGIGIREECIYRATLQNIVAKKYANSVKGIWITVVVSAILFGLCHISNLFFGMHPLSVLSQVISAACIGTLFSAVYLRSGSLWAPILVHTLTDIAGLAPSTFLRNISDVENVNQLSISWGSLLFDLLYVVLAVFLLRPSKCKQIYQNLCFAEEDNGGL
jgi:membrane protease YdiL (CAAX protease family)